MVQIMTKACHEGACEHAPFPHKIVENITTESRQIGSTRKRESVRTGVVQHVICLACGHWASPARDCNCRYDCHNSGIKASLTVLD